MTEPRQSRNGVELLDIGRLRLVEVAEPEVPPAERRAMERVWDEAARGNPALFDGPVAGCAGLHRDAADDLAVTVTWARTTYRRHALRRVPGATSVLPSLGAAVVQATDDGRLLVGRMASWTVAAGRWQLPGGAVEPPHEGGSLDVAALSRHAARELAEETGVVTSPSDLAPWCVTRGAQGNVAVLFLAPPRPESQLSEQYAALAAVEAAAGRAPELDRIAFVGSAPGLAALEGPLVDFLEPVVRRYAAERGVRRAAWRSR